jgi:hypothetical protein
MIFKEGDEVAIIPPVSSGWPILSIDSLTHVARGMECTESDVAR